MNAALGLVYLKVMPTAFPFSCRNSLSVGPFDKHLDGQSSLRTSRKKISLCAISSPLPSSLSITSGYNAGKISTGAQPNPYYSRTLLSPPTRIRTQLLPPINCSYPDTTSTGSMVSIIEKFKNISFDSIKASISHLTPIDICTWSLLFSTAIAATKGMVSLMLNPFFWMYFSWTWLFWPWFVAIGLAIYGIYCLRKHLIGEANMFEQLAIVTSSLTWLTLVPPAHSNGFLEGWPFVFFFVYHYFFFFNVSVRKRLYGDYYPREHDPKWDISLPSLQQLLFCAGVLVGHWLTAFEGPELHLIPGGWNNLGIWALIMLCLFMQYHSTLYLAKYSEKVVVPMAVVQFGPYRFVRHPIYASTMLLFVTYFIALRAPLSSLFITAVCLMYYGQKAKIEEALMFETFGDKYSEYVNKVKYMFIPFVY